VTPTFFELGAPASPPLRGIKLVKRGTQFGEGAARDVGSKLRKGA
jgi:hypothetical protein